MAKKKVVKSVAKKQVKKKVTSKKMKKAIVRVKYDCGLPNHLAIRGEGAGLSWDKGSVLKNQDRDVWSFEIISKEPEVEFKVLLNDQVFEIGNNHVVKMGEDIEIFPRFD